MQIQKIKGMYVALIKQNVGSDKKTMVRAKTIKEVLELAFAEIEPKDMAESIIELGKDISEKVLNKELKEDDLVEAFDTIKELEKDNKINMENEDDEIDREDMTEEELAECPCMRCTEKLKEKKTKRLIAKEIKTEDIETMMIKEGIETPNDFLKEIISLLSDKKMDVNEKSERIAEINERILTATERVKAIKTKGNKKKSLGKLVMINLDDPENPKTITEDVIEGSMLERLIREKLIKEDTNIEIIKEKKDLDKALEKIKDHIKEKIDLDNLL